MGNPRLQNFVWDTPEERRWREGRGAAQCLQDLQQAVTDQRWPEAIEAAHALLEAIASLAGSGAEGVEAYWREAVGAIGSLTAVLHPGLMIQAEQPLPEPQRAELCWRLGALLDHLLTCPLPQPLPGWMASVHTRVLLYGGVYWRARLPDAEAASRMAHLFGRAAHRLDPLPPWLGDACRQLGIAPIADPAPAASTAVAPADPSADAGVDPSAGMADAAAPPGPAVPPSPAAEPAPSRLWPPSQLAEELEQWLLDAGPGRPLRIGLVWVPGAAMLCREGPRLDLNSAALLEDPSGMAPDPWLEALRDPLQRAAATGWLPQLELREPLSSLYEALAHQWRLGVAMPLRRLQRLPALLDAWQRLLGPAQLQAQRLPGTLLEVAGRPADAAARLQVSLDPLELATLLACDPNRFPQPGDARAELEAVLARLRRDHLNPDFWQAPSAGLTTTETSPLEALRLLHRDAGFYASSADGFSCLATWREGVLACLERAQIWGAEQSPSPVALLHLAQLLSQRAGRLPDLQPRQGWQELLERMGGKEVLFVGWSARAVLEQHRSGRAFRLFHDRSIVPYGLRTLAMPDSRHPHRPAGGFRDSLERLIEAVEREHAARPIQLLLVEGGAYRLPLIERIEQRHGIPAVAPGPELLALFGLDRPGLPPWRESQRNPEAWRIACGTIGPDVAPSP